LLALGTVAAAALVMTFPALVHSLTARAPHGGIRLLLPAGAVGAVVAGAYACQLMRSWLSQDRIADTLTGAAALLATCASASGMWAFFTRYVSHSIVERASLFAFLEVCALALAVRARARCRDGRRAGADLTGMWAAASLSAVLASTAALSPAEAVFRFTTPLTAAWMWERAIASDSPEAADNRRARELAAALASVRRWVLTRLGLADLNAWSASETAGRRLVVALALAAERSGTLGTAQAPAWRRRAAERRLRAATRAAAPFLADNPEERAYLATLVRMLGSSRDLAAAAAGSHWQWLPAEPGENSDRRYTSADFDDLAGGLAEALHRKDYDAIHEALAGRDDYPDLARWIACRDLTNGKQLLALTAMYADRRPQAPVVFARWIAKQIEGLPGLGEYAIPDQVEISRIQDALAESAAWHNSPDAPRTQAAA